jgi:hypothetical protein
MNKPGYYIHKEVPQGNSLCSYHKEGKISFLNSLYCKSEPYLQIREQVLPGGIDTSGRGEEVVKGCRRVNMV